MEIFTGKSMMTITASPGVSKISYETAVAVDIFNDTSEKILVNTSGNFESGEYLTIPAESGFNGLHIGTASGTELYIKINVAGEISLVCGRY